MTYQNRRDTWIQVVLWAFFSFNIIGLAHAQQTWPASVQRTAQSDNAVRQQRQSSFRSATPAVITTNNQCEVLLVDGEGVPENLEVSDSKQIPLPVGTPEVTVSVVVFSREWPEFTSEQSEFNDTVRWSVRVGGSTITQGQQEVNALDGNFASGSLPGGNFKIFQDVIDTSAITATSSSSAQLSGSAINIADPDLGSGVFIELCVAPTITTPPEEPPVEEPPSDDEVSEIIGDFEQAIPNLPANESAALSSIATSVTTGQATARLTADFGSLQQAAQANDPNIARAVGQVTPDQSQAPSDASLNSVGLQIGNIGARLMALRMGTASGFDLAGLSIDIDGHRISGRQVQGLMEAFANGGAASADDSGFSRLGVFVSGRLSRGTRDETANVDGFKYRITGLTAGADYRLQDDLIVGGALGYSRAKTDIRNEGGDVDADNYSATLYGTWYQDSGVFVDGSLTYSRGDFDQQRNVNYTLPTQGVTVDQIFDASFKGNTFGISLSGGYEFRQDALTLVPFARLQYLRARIDGYQETVRRPGEAGDGLGVEIDKQRLTSFTSALGVQANYAISQPWGVLMPFASAEWVHEFDKSNDNVTGRFLGDRGGNTFSFAVDDTDSNYFDLGVGVAAQFTQGTSGFVNYQRIEGFSNLSHYSVNAGLRFEF